MKLGPEALQAEPLQIAALAVALSLAPPADSLGNDDLVVNSLTLRLRSLAPVVLSEAGTAGAFGVEVEVEAFDIDVEFIAGSVCHTTPIDVSTSADQRLRLSGPLLTTARLIGLTTNTDPLLGQPKILVQGAFVPPPEADPGGNIACNAIADTFFGSTVSGDAFGGRLVGRQASRVLGAVIVDPALDSALAPVTAQEAWTLHVSSTGRVRAIVPE